jgi:hypothetical protein
MRIVLISLLVLLATTLTDDCTADNWTVRLKLQGRSVEGTLLSWSEDRVYLLARDGYLWDFAPEEARDFSKVSDSFRSYSQSELRGRLLREFGQRFDVSGTGHYLVVHPVGERDLWAERFEELYRSFVHYFTARGLPPQSPQFPLIAVVFPQQQDFLRYAAREGVNFGPGVLGYYSTISNRIVLYDWTAGSAGQHDWQENAETIIHEAAHQTAFNTAVHGRYTLPPRWLIEGLGTMFEAPGVWNSRHYTAQGDRINRNQLQAFKHYAATRRRAGAVAELIASDRLFQYDPNAAYAEAWALTFFLAETEPRKYLQYLSATAAKAPFMPYLAPERLRDFSAIFGDNLAMLEAHMLRFIATLK